MREVELIQVEADRLLRLDKERVDDRAWDFPGLGEEAVIPLRSVDGREDFLLDVGRSKIRLRKLKYQTRVHKVVILARLDIGGRPHENPDGERIPCPHLHVYREGFGTRWAIPLPNEDFSKPEDLMVALDDFFTFCHVVRPPDIQGPLF